MIYRWMESRCQWCTIIVQKWCTFWGRCTIQMTGYGFMFSIRGWVTDRVMKSFNVFIGELLFCKMLEPHVVVNNITLVVDNCGKKNKKPKTMVWFCNILSKNFVIIFFVFYVSLWLQDFDIFSIFETEKISKKNGKHRNLCNLNRTQNVTLSDKYSCQYYDG